MTRPFIFAIITALAMTSRAPDASAQLPPPTVEGTTPQTVTTAQTERDPHRQLALARQQLQAISATTLSSDGKKKLTKLQADFDLLVKNYDRRAQTPAASATPGAGTKGEVVDWKLQFDAVERDLVAILGAGPLLSDSPAVTGTSGVAATTRPPEVSGTPQPVAGQPAQPALNPSEAAQLPPSLPAGAVPPSPQPASGAVPPGQAAAAGSPSQAAGVTGAQAGQAAATSAGSQQAGLVGVATVSDIGVKNLDPAVRSQLEAMRKSVEMFYDATTSLRRP